MKKMTVIGAVLAIVVGVIGILEYTTSLNLRWWIWRSEHITHARADDKKIMVLTERVDRNELNRVKLRLYRQQGFKGQLEKERLVVPRDLKDEIRLLKKRRETLEDKIKPGR